MKKPFEKFVRAPAQSLKGSSNNNLAYGVLNGTQSRLSSGAVQNRNYSVFSSYLRKDETEMPGLWSSIPLVQPEVPVQKLIVKAKQELLTEILNHKDRWWISDASNSGKNFENKDKLTASELLLTFLKDDGASQVTFLVERQPKVQAALNDGGLGRLYRSVLEYKLTLSGANRDSLQRQIDAIPPAMPPNNQQQIDDSALRNQSTSSATEATSSKLSQEVQSLQQNISEWTAKFGDVTKQLGEQDALLKTTQSTLNAKEGELAQVSRERAELFSNAEIENARHQGEIKALEARMTDGSEQARASLAAAIVAEEKKHTGLMEPLQAQLASTDRQLSELTTTHSLLKETLLEKDSLVKKLEVAVLSMKQTNEAMSLKLRAAKNKTSDQQEANAVLKKQLETQTTLLGSTKTNLDSMKTELQRATQLARKQEKTITELEATSSNLLEETKALKTVIQEKDRTIQEQAKELEALKLLRDALTKNPTGFTLEASTEAMNQYLDRIRELQELEDSQNQQIQNLLKQGNHHPIPAPTPASMPAPTPAPIPAAPPEHEPPVDKWKRFYAEHKTDTDEVDKRYTTAEIFRQGSKILEEQGVLVAINMTYKDIQDKIIYSQFQNDATPVICPTSGQEYLLSFKDRVPSAILKKENAERFPDDTPEQRLQRRAATVINMIDNVLAKSEEIKITTTDPFLNEIANLYLKHLQSIKVAENKPFNIDVKDVKPSVGGFSDASEDVIGEAKTEAGKIFNKLKVYMPAEEIKQTPWFQDAVAFRLENENQKRAGLPLGQG